MNRASESPPRLRLKLLLWIPAAVYLLSYVYLAFYHRNAWLFTTVIHEGGTLTLWETVLYASHFLGHVPSLTVIALLFAGSVFMLANPQPSRAPSVRSLLGLTAAFLAVCFALSVSRFGWTETIEYIAQTRQGVSYQGEGGSWNLHLPSTTLLFLFVPVYVAVMGAITGFALNASRRGWPLVVAAALLTMFFTALFNAEPLQAMMTAWTDPRYLAHSVRELATFPLTFFPIAFYVLYRSAASAPRKPSRTTKTILWICGVLTAGLTAYQCAVPLREGIGSLAQKPEFAEGGSLGIPYLLASHYFEHVLDSIYFTLLTLLILSALRKQKSL